MILTKLTLHDFRNYIHQEVEFSSKSNMILGENGQGKSNFLEALFFVSTGFSPTANREKDLIRWGCERCVLRLEGYFEKTGSSHVQSVEIHLGGSKTVKVNESPSAKLADLLGNYGIVFFLPGDIQLIDGAPSLRRRYLDSILCQFSASYLGELRQYKRILQQRNAVLKEPGRYSRSVAEVLTDQLIGHGSRVTLERARFARRLGDLAGEMYEKVSGLPGVFGLKYAASASGQTENLEEINAEFIQKIHQAQESEKFQKITLYGPHRDNLLFLLQEKAAGEFGSQGQKRLIALSLKLAGARVLQREFSSPPVLLLDDVFSDLDEPKRLRLSNMLTEHSQIFIASARAQDIPFAVDKTFKVEGGIVSL